MNNNNLVPMSIDAEACVLGSMMYNEQGIAVARKMLRADDFHRPAHQIIFDALLKMNAPVDFVTLKAQLEADGTFEKIGGLEYLVAIYEGVPGVANVEYYARIVRDKAIRRGMLQIGGSCTIKANDGDMENTQSLLSGLQHDVYALSRRLSDGYTGESTFGGAVQEAIDLQKAAIEDPTILEGIKTGLQGIDSVTNGFKPGQLVVLAADTSAGKSAMALQWAVHAAINNQKVLVVSAEMSTLEMGQRIIQSQGRVHGGALQQGVRDEQDWKEINKLQETIRDVRGYIVETSPTVRDIAMLARERSSLWGGLDIIIVDYLQLMQSEDLKKSLREQISTTTRDLKTLAAELKVPIVLLSQFERGGVKYNSMPTIHNLKESGSIEQDASIIILLYWDRTKEKVHEFGESYFEIWARVAKNRSGRTTTWKSDDSEIRLKFYRSQTRFEDLTI